MEVNIKTTRGRVVKKYTDVFLKTQYSKYLFETIFRSLKIRFNDVVMEFLIEGLGQKIWQLLTLKLRSNNNLVITNKKSVISNLKV